MGAPAGSAPLEERTDNELMIVYRGGDVKAFEVLYRRYRVAVYNFCLRMVRSPEVAADVMQDVFAKVIRTSSWKPTGKFSAWLFTIARNLSLDTLQKVRRIDSNAEVDVVAAAPIAEGDPPLRKVLGRLVEALPDEQREVFLLRAYAELTFAEIAEMTDVSIGTAKSRMRLATQDLKKRLMHANVVPGAEA